MGHWVSPERFSCGQKRRYQAESSHKKKPVEAWESIGILSICPYLLVVLFLFFSLSLLPNVIIRIILFTKFLGIGYE